MSVNDGFSDDEWGAWGKPDTTVISQQTQQSTYTKVDNGFTNDDEDNNYKKSNDRYNQDKPKQKFQDRGYNGGGNKFSRRNEESENTFRRHDNNGRNNYNRDDSRENRNNYRNNNRKDEFRDDSKENRNNYQRNERNNNFKRDDSGERNNYRKRDDSRENRNAYRNRNNYFDHDDFSNNRGNNHQNKSDKYGRDDSASRNDRRYKNDHNFEQNDYKDTNNYRRNDTRNNFKRDESGERNNFRYSKRDNSEPGETRTRNTHRNNERKYNFERDDSQEKRYKNHEEYRRPDSSRERRNNSNRDIKRHDSDDSFNDRRENNTNSQSRRERNDNGLSDNLNRNLRLDDEDGYSSRTFIRGKKTSEHDNQNDDAAIPKRATFIPNDDQEDYELHVNSGINFDNYDKIPVEVTGDQAPSAVTSFSDLKLPEFLFSNIGILKYNKLTPVQKYAIPIIDSNRDLMACAQTGSGKTAAFLIPIIKSLHENAVETPASQVGFPKALIMAPTRELCRQIFTAARQLCRGSSVKCAYIYGGIEMNKSRRNIQSSGCDILVATPGRLIHFLELVWISLRYLKYFVLDEADRMLESEGFYESVNKIYNEANISGEDKTIQISMFSATFPNEIQTLARNLLKNYLFLAVGVVGSANSDVKQEIIQSNQKDKVNTAIEYIKTIPDEKTLVFVESKRMADFFGIKLGYLGFKATTIHGDREQEQREIALNDFKSGRVNFMVATNVAARGLDIPKVDNVINIDMPGDIDTYVHRIGRTGRCGNVGRAISFFDETKDIALASGLVSKLEEANQEVADWLRALCDGTSVRRTNYSRDTRKDVKVSKFMDNPNDDFMKGTNVDYYDDAKPTSEWLDD